LVTTIYDMIPELFPQYFRRNQHEAKIVLAERSDAVLCISVTARDDLLRMSRVRPEKTFVSPLATETLSRHDIGTANRDRRLLYVGHRSAYKNFETLLDALTLVRETEFEVLCVGGGPLAAAELARVAALPSGVRLQQCNLSELDLRGAYLTSAALVSPSLAEGFGLPVLEAMGAGCPVLLSDIPVYREFWSGLDGFFPPADAVALAAGIDIVLGLDAERLRARGQQGWQLAQAFSWKATAAATSDVYRRVLGR
jgi:glycosyltransferase involved in cell wall biosynthesis